MTWGWIPHPAGGLQWVRLPVDRKAEAARRAASKRRREKEREQARRRRGLIYVLRSNGATTAEIARALGVSWPRVRQLEAGIDAAIHREADRRFPIPRWYDWSRYAEDLAALVGRRAVADPDRWFAR